MKRQDILSILITFTIGLFAGGYIYLTGFAPTIANLAVPSEQKLNELVVESEVYGGCRAACPSYQLLGNGSYRYLYSTSFDSDQILKTGNIPFGLRRDLQNTLTEAELLRQSQVTTPALCESFSDGIDVRYEITLDGKVYTLDTCGTAVNADSALWLNLGRVWDYLEISGVN